MQASSETRVLLGCATRRDVEITCALLAAAGLACVYCETLRRLADEAERGAGAILLTDDALLAPDLDLLVRTLRQQPSWSEIPIVLLLRPERGVPTADQLLSRLRNVTVLERPASTRTLVSTVMAAVRGRQRQYQIRDQFEAIGAAQARFEAMANFIPQLAWMSRPDGWIFWYNRRWYEYTGTTPRDMEGWGWTAVHDPAELESVLQTWRRCLGAGEPFDMTFPIRGADGRFRPFLTRAMPFRNEQGEIILWFGTNTDVTVQRQMMAEREDLLARERAARADSEAASRLKDEFLATLSHELRTPLSAILGWAQLLRRLDLQNETLSEGLVVIERNSRLQAQLIEDLLDMSRVISGKMRMDVRPVNVAETIDAAIESLRPAAESKGIRIEQATDDGVCPVRADPARLQQIVWNLLSNAVKFTPAGGRVRISVRRMQAHLEIAVADTGIGIKAEFLPYVFERFRQADSSTTRTHGGLGLGLAIVKNLVELHGGRVRAMSTGENRGATFIVELPIMAVKSPDGWDEGWRETDGDRSLSRWEPEALRGLTVLVVDDEPDARVLIARVLEESHARVHVASSAAEAVDAVKRLRPAVLVSDIGMPHDDGYELIRAVRSLPEAEGGKTPAVALTAFARLEDRTRALRAGYQSHVAKPVEPTHLVATVASLAAVGGPAPIR